MGRTVGAVGRVTKRLINEAAIELFARKNFEAVALHEVAEKVGIRVGSLYNHIKTKEDLLSSILTDLWQELLEDLRTEVLTQPTPILQIDALVHSILKHQHQRNDQTKILARTELWRLTKTRQKAIAAQQREYVEGLKSILLTGQQQSLFSVANLELSAQAIIALLWGLSSPLQKASPSESLPQLEVMTCYRTYIMRMIGVSEAAIKTVEALPNRIGVDKTKPTARRGKRKS